MAFNINDHVTPIVLEYLEPGSTEQTMNCLLAAGFEQENILQVGREGVGSMSAAFNRVFEGVYGFDVVHTPYVWFVTNVTFGGNEIHTMWKFMQRYNANRCAAVHPKFASDHPFIRDAGDEGVIPFVELTAPLIRVDALKDIGLMDEKMPYWGMDADWGYRAKQKGWYCAVDGLASVRHTYLHQSQPHPISRIRQALRSLYDESTRARLVEKYGTNWKQKICPGGGC